MIEFVETGVLCASQQPLFDIEDIIHLRARLPQDEENRLDHILAIFFHIYIINASGEDGMIIDLQKKPRRCSAYNVFGEPVSIPVPRTGLSRVSVPKSGYVIIEY